VIDLTAAANFASSSLASLSDPAKAADMARYMKTDMPFYGVQKAGRGPICRQLIRRWPPATRSEYTALVRKLWALPHREEKYLALGVARAHSRFVTLSSTPLYRRLIVEGAWWDLVDEAATKLAGTVLLHQRDAMTPTIVKWLDHQSLWLRRAAIISQVGHKKDTDADLLFLGCSSRAHETDFFIRKAIGWALRDYAWTAPDAVGDFVRSHQGELSGLSKREATKNL
jgi:3-methyladenine DNA glycosylase AlkD